MELLAFYNHFPFFPVDGIVVAVVQFSVSHSTSIQIARIHVYDGAVYLCIYLYTHAHVQVAKCVANKMCVLLPATKAVYVIFD